VKICVVDFEATCWDNDKTKRDQMEIIEIGAVLLDEKLDPIKEFQAFIKPTRNEVLSDFCKGLTSIKQEDVDGAQFFPEVMIDFRRWLEDPTDILFASWGNYDYNQLKKDVAYHKVQYPFNESHMNIKEHFSYKQGVGGKGVSKALTILGIKFEGTPHRGIDDARNIAKILKKVGL